MTFCNFNDMSMSCHVNDTINETDCGFSINQEKNNLCFLNQSRKTEREKERKREKEQRQKTHTKKRCGGGGERENNYFIVNII